MSEGQDKRVSGVGLIAGSWLAIAALLLLSRPLREFDQGGWIGVVACLALGLPLLLMAAGGILPALESLWSRESGGVFARSWRLLVANATWRSLMAAVPCTIAALTLGACWVFDYVPSWESRRTVMQYMNLEFITMHSMLFLGVVALTKVKGSALRLLKWSAFAGLAWAYLAIADHSLDDRFFYELCTVSAAKWAFLLLRPPREARLRILVSRWAVGAMLMMLYGMVLFDAEPSGPTSLAPGTLYFATLALLEALGILSADPDPQGQLQLDS